MSGGVAGAQSVGGPPPGAEPAAADGSPPQFVSDEIIVSARKRAERAQTIPVALTALMPDQIERFEINGLERIAATTPDLEVSPANEGLGAQLTMRGVGSSFLSVGIGESTAATVGGSHCSRRRVLNEAQPLRAPAIGYEKDRGLRASRMRWAA
jgi:hypothetical protein